MRILGIDPGYDVVAACVLNLHEPPNTLQDALRGYVRCKRVQTNLRDERSDRLAEISSWTAANLELIDVVVVEVPAIHGKYARYANHKISRKGVDLLHCALGAILAAAGMSDAEVVELAADTMRKGQRHALLETAARQVGLSLPEGPRGGKREDEWDAIWTAARWALNAPRSRW
jgi:hypothetical protein